MKIIHAKDGVRNERVTFRLSKEEYKMLDHISKKTGLNKSDVIRSLMYDYVKEPDNGRNSK